MHGAAPPESPSPRARVRVRPQYVAFSADSRLLAASSDSLNAIVVWRMPEGNLARASVVPTRVHLWCHPARMRLSRTLLRSADRG